MKLQYIITILLIFNVQNSFTASGESQVNQSSTDQPLSPGLELESSDPTQRISHPTDQTPSQIDHDLQQFFSLDFQEEFHREIERALSNQKTNIPGGSENNPAAPKLSQAGVYNKPQGLLPQEENISAESDLEFSPDLVAELEALLARISNSDEGSGGNNPAAQQLSQAGAATHSLLSPSVSLERPSQELALEDLDESKRSKRDASLQKKYSCARVPGSDCFYGTEKHSDLKRHISLLHTQEERFSCSICGKSFKGGRKSVLNHLKKEHPQERNGESVVLLDTPKTDLYVSKTEKKYECAICNRTFSSKQQLNAHQKIHREGQRNQFNDYQELPPDLESERMLPTRITNIPGGGGNNPAAQQLSQAGAATHSLLSPSVSLERPSQELALEDLDESTRAKRDASLQKKYSCARIPGSDCFYGTERLIEMKRHASARHTHENRYSCSICGKSFKGEQQYIHLKKAHPQAKNRESLVLLDTPRTDFYVSKTEKKYECDICNRNFSSKRKLNTHKRVHRE